MTDSLFISLLVLLAGFALGFIFFGGLWITVKNIAHAKQPALLFIGSLIFRLAISLLGFYFIGYHNWQRMLLLLFGFMSARYIIMRLTKSEKLPAFFNLKKTKNET